MSTALDVPSTSYEERRRPPARPPTPPSSGTSLSALAFLAFAALWTVLLVAARPFDGNGWWHLTNGSLILRDGSLPVGDPFSWAAAGKSAVLDGWLYDVFVAGIAETVGVTAISVLALGAMVGLAWGVYRRSRDLGAPAWPAAVAAVVTLVLVKGFVAERPQVVSYLLFLALVVLAERALAGSNRAWLGAGAIVALWANVHLAFTLGVGVVGLLALAEIFRSRSWARPTLVVLSLLGAGLVNPYGARVYLLPFEARVVASRIIQEWRPWSASYGYDLLLLVVVVAVALSLAVTGRWRDLRVALPVVFLVALSADAIRNTPFLLVVAAPELALGLSALTARRKPADSGSTRRATRSRAVAHGAVVATVVLAVGAFGDLGGFREQGLPSYPVRATAAIPSGCKLLNEDTFGGYVAETRTADVRVSQDGRQVEGVDSLVAQQRALGARPGWRSWLDRHGVECVLAAPDRPLVDRLERLGWRRRAADPSGVLMVRPDVVREARPEMRPEVSGATRSPVAPR